MDKKLEKNLIAEREKRLMVYLGPILDVLEKQSNLKEIKERIKLIKDEGMVPVEAMEKEELRVNKIIEVEDKYEISDLLAFQKEAEKQNFNLESEIIQDDSYLDKSRLLRGANQLLRIRKTLDKMGIFESGELKWEGPKGKLSDRPVVEVSIPTEIDCNDLKRFIEDTLGIKEIVRLKKHRWHYLKDEEGRKMEIELDYFDDQSNLEKIKGRMYIQVAMEVPPEKRDESLLLVEEIAKKLGLEKRDNRDYEEIAGA